MPNLSSLVSIALGGLLFVGLKKMLDFWSGQKRGPYPPGPKPKFLIGNALDFPMTGAGHHFMEVGAQLQSGLVYLNVLGNHILFINKKSVADDLLEKRAKIYSGRPQLAATLAMGWDTTNVSLMDYGDNWRRHRKVSQQHLNKRKTKSYEPIQKRHLHKMLHRLLHSPEDFWQHSEVLSTAIIMDIMYGYQIDRLDDPANAAALKMLELGLPLVMPGGALMNVLPFLRHLPAWIPGNSAGKAVKECEFWTREMLRIPLEDLAKRMKEGTATYSIVSECWEKKGTADADLEAESVLYGVTWTMYAAAMETTVSSTTCFFYTMLMHPEFQRKAQAEIDKIVGTNRLPTFEDRPSLPYIEAIYREVMRYAPPLYIGLPHASREDDWYDGYFIPKGTTVFANLWAMTHDETIYRDANAFNPERFFDERGELNDDDQILAYGFGRRVCVGKYVASATLWITIVSILACFNIEKAKDEYGNDIEVNDEYIDFGLTISEGARKLVEDAMVGEGK
ncbi:hypothetical protein NLJ89_g4329 [Agrocybe chaxingu]|uniref:Cytochrome P450 n=1 Tax=Agrocybe chaxingu TaxID=84603 RepID=A0A9W8MUN1_9AGAR|nr:hypothetical protein NLJ89_g4329 [Agrocybe chaxingu]